MCALITLTDVDESSWQLGQVLGKFCQRIPLSIYNGSKDVEVMYI